MRLTAVRRAAVLLAFPGQGCQFPGMAKPLLSHAAARRVFEEVDDAVGAPVCATMVQDAADPDFLNDTSNAQVAILAASVAAARVIGAHLPGEVTCVAGHSVGEYAALVYADALSVADAARVVRARGHAMNAAAAGQGPTAMSALVPATADVVSGLCDAVSAELGVVVQVATVNTPQQVVVSGHESGVAEVERRAKAAKAARRCVRLPVSAPYHCALMAAAVPALRQALEEATLKPPAHSVVFNATCGLAADPAEIRELLLRNLTEPVLWMRCVESAAAAVGSDGVLVEAGPKPVLSAFKYTPPFSARFFADVLPQHNH